MIIPTRMLRSVPGRLLVPMFVLFLFSAPPAPAAPASGIYRITSGEFRECCGIAGLSMYALPTKYQAFLRLTVDVQDRLATITLLADDTNTVFYFGYFETSPFQFANGTVFADYIQFGDPALPPPQPNQPAYCYVISNTAGGLLLSGALIQSYACCDIPNEFSHSNITAVLVRNDSHPALGPPHLSTNGTLLFTIWNGQAGQTNIVEAATELTHWDAIGTNVFPPTLCPTCPFIEFEDSFSTNFSHRFYRSYLIP